MDIRLEDVRGFSVSRPQDVSAFHLIVWVFAVACPLEEQQRRRVKAIYGDSSETIDPVAPTPEAFRRLMQAIRAKNQKCLVKVLADSRLSKKILQEAGRDHQIIQIFLFKPKAPIQLSPTKELKTHSEIVKKGTDLSLFANEEEKNEEKQINVIKSEIHEMRDHGKVVGVLHDLNLAIERAERQVQVFTKSFRTFENSECLTGDFEGISRYRFRLIACINLKVSDFARSLQAFKHFVFTALPSLNAHLQGMGQNALPNQALLASLYRYETVALAFGRAEEERAQQELKEKDTGKGKGGREGPIKKEMNGAQNDGRSDSLLPPSLHQAQQEAFFHEMISIYQDEGLFYHLLNSHLKLVGERGAAWKQLALPFAHLHRAVKHLYRQGLAAEPQFYGQPFTVFRGGRARQSELQRYKDAVAAGGAFVEFFGFLSTSLSAKIVADKFVTVRNSRDGGRQGEGADDEVVFRIRVNPCAGILAAKYDSLVNGFYRLTARQTYGETEQEVLFNAMNVFRLTAVTRQAMGSLFSPAELEEAVRKEREAKTLPTFKYREEQTRSAFYGREVTVVELEFGSFYEALLAKNRFDLSPQERAAKENYVHCLNRVGRYDKFDYGDACELTNELQESYAYLRSKVGGSEEDLFLSSRTDNKNYFTRLSAVCQKLGKTKEALAYSRIAIECYKQLESIHLNEVYNSHYERLFDMQMRSIEILQESSNFAAADKQLREQLQLVRSKNFGEARVRLREAEVYINQAINYYSMGKLEECTNRFAKCQHQLVRTIAAFSFADEPLPCYLPAFLAQLLCPHPLRGRTLSYAAFGEQLQQLRREQRERELVQRHGRREELEQTSKLANDLLSIANEAVRNRQTLFKSRKKYTEFISKFSNQLSLSILSAPGEQSQERRGTQEKIKQRISKLSSLQQESSQYSQVLAEFNQLIDRYSELERSEIAASRHSEASIWDFIKKFKERERERKIRRLQDLKDNILAENRHQLVEHYLSCAAEVEQAISELKAEGYVDSSLSILKMRVEKSKIYQECDDRVSALSQIQEIIKNGLDGEDRHTELAHAYSIKGKIHLEMNEIELAIAAFNEALLCFPKAVPEEDEESLDVSAVTETPFESAELKANELHHNNDYLKARILRMKALLMWIELKRTRENGIPSSKFDPCRDGPWQTRHSDDLMRDVQVEVCELRAILTARSQLEDIEELKCVLLEVEMHFFINCPPSEANVAHAFESFRECLSLQSHQNGRSNPKNGLLCCELICRHSARKDVLCKFLQLRHTEELSAAEADLKHCNFAWKIQKSYFLLERAEGRDAAARAHLQRAIKLLEAEIACKRDSLLEDELNSLKWKLAERPRKVLSSLQNEASDWQLPMQSTLIRGQRGRYQPKYRRNEAKPENSVSTANSFISANSSLKTTEVSIKPLQHQNPQSQMGEIQVSSLALRKFCRRIGRRKGSRRKFVSMIE